MTAEERALVARAQRDPEAFGEIYRLHYDAVFGYVYRTLRGDPLAEDLVADVFVRALAAIGRFQPGPASLRNWLMQIASNRLVDHHRHEAAKSRYFAVAVRLTLSSLDAPAPESDLSPELLDALAAVPPRQRRAFILCHALDLSYAQVARRMGTTENAVRLLLHRGTKTVREMLAA